LRKTLTDKGVLALRPKPTRYHFPDPELTGHYVRVLPSGTKTFTVVARGPDGQVWHTVGGTDLLKIEQSRDLAREAIKRIKVGLTPEEPPPEQPDSFKAVAQNWIKRYAKKEQLRTLPEIERCLKVYVYPEWADRPFPEIKRSDFSKLLDAIEDERGTRMAEIVRGHVRAIGNWEAGRSGDYVSPFNARGKRSSSGTKRERFLDDDELRAVWKEANRSGSFGALIKTLLLTGQRRGAVLSMKWDAISDDGTWTIAAEAREKINAGSLKLPPQVLQIINAQPRLASNDHVFAASRGNGPMNGFSRAKVSFDKKCGVEGWTLHDLRRCARTLLARCDVRPDIAEVTLGHVIAGIEGRYNVHDYSTEKAVALAKLAALVDAIVDPDRRGNVVPMQKGKRQ
jgi:integrase